MNTPLESIFDEIALEIGSSMTAEATQTVIEKKTEYWESGIYGIHTAIEYIGAQFMEHLVICQRCYQDTQQEDKLGIHFAKAEEDRKAVLKIELPKDPLLRCLYGRRLERDRKIQPIGRHILSNHLVHEISGIPAEYIKRFVYAACDIRPQDVYVH